MTSGDRPRVGDKSRWVDALERALLAGEIDLAVHSAKDVPGELADGHRDRRRAGARGPARRADRRASLDALPAGARVGTASLRRRAQLLARAARPRGRRAARQRRHAPAQARRRRGRRARARRRRARAPRPRRTGRRRAGRDVSCPRRGRAPAAPGARRRRRSAGRRPTPTRVRRAAAPSARSRRALGASCHTPVGVHAAGGSVRAWRRGCPTARRGCDELEARRRPAALRASGCSPPAPPSCWPARRRWRRDRLPRRRRPGRPGPADRARAELIARADVILYDRLIPASALDGARPDAELRLRRQAGRRPAVPQEETNRLLVEHAPRGQAASCGSRAATRSSSAAAARRRSVLRAAGIPFEVVPGVTAGIAAPAYAGIPVTHRDLASGVAFVTGHEDPDKPETRSTGRRSPRSRARSSSTWACARCRGSPTQLIAGGRARGRAGRGRRARARCRGQRTLLATLGDVAERRRPRRHPRAARSRSSGRSRRSARARLARAAAAARPQRRVTRARAQASALAARLRELGADGRRGAGDPDAPARRPRCRTSPASTCSA